MNKIFYLSDCRKIYILTFVLYLSFIIILKVMPKKKDHHYCYYILLLIPCYLCQGICICLILIQLCDFFWHCQPRRISPICYDWLFIESSSIFRRNFAMLACFNQHNQEIVTDLIGGYLHLWSLPICSSFCWRIIHLFVHL